MASTPYNSISMQAICCKCIIWWQRHFRSYCWARFGWFKKSWGSGCKLLMRSTRHDRTFHNFGALKSVARRSWTSWTSRNSSISWSWGSKIVQGFVGATPFHNSIPRTTLLNMIEFADFLIFRLKKCERAGRESSKSAGTSTIVSEEEEEDKNVSSPKTPVAKTKVGLRCILFGLPLTSWHQWVFSSFVVNPIEGAKLHPHVTGNLFYRSNARSPRRQLLLEFTVN